MSSEKREGDDTIARIIARARGCLGARGPEAVMRQVGAVLVLERGAETVPAVLRAQTRVGQHRLAVPERPDVVAPRERICSHEVGGILPNLQSANGNMGGVNRAHATVEDVAVLERLVGGVFDPPDLVEEGQAVALAVAVACNRGGPGTEPLPPTGMRYAGGPYQ